MTTAPTPAFCGTRKDHISHPHAGGRKRCAGWGRFHDDMLPKPVSDNVCGFAFTGPTGIRWVCRGHEHPYDPTEQPPRGHSFEALPREKIDHG